MCFASSSAPAQPVAPQWEYFMKDAPDVIVPEGTRHAMRRARAPAMVTSIMGGDWTGANGDGSANSPGGSDGESSSAAP